MRAIPKVLPESALDIGMPDRRAKRCTPPRAEKQGTQTEYQRNQADREAWMRERQARKRDRARAEKRRVIAEANAQPTHQERKERDEARRMAEVEGQMEAVLLHEAEGEVRRRKLLGWLRGTVNKEGPDTTEEG